MRYRDQHWGNPHQIVAVSAADLIRVHGKRASESVDEREAVGGETEKDGMT